MNYGNESSMSANQLFYSLDDSGALKQLILSPAISTFNAVHCSRVVEGGVGSASSFRPGGSGIPPLGATQFPFSIRPSHMGGHFPRVDYLSSTTQTPSLPARTKIHLGWIASWQWASTAKKIFQTHVKTFSRVLNSLAVEFSP